MKYLKAIAFVLGLVLGSRFTDWTRAEMCVYENPYNCSLANEDCPMDECVPSSSGNCWPKIAGDGTVTKTFEADHTLMGEGALPPAVTGEMQEGGNLYHCKCEWDDDADKNLCKGEEWYDWLLEEESFAGNEPCPAPEEPEEP